MCSCFIKQSTFAFQSRTTSSNLQSFFSSILRIIHIQLRTVYAIICPVHLDFYIILPSQTHHYYPSQQPCVPQPPSLSLSLLQQRPAKSPQASRPSTRRTLYVLPAPLPSHLQTFTNIQIARPLRQPHLLPILRWPGLLWYSVLPGSHIQGHLSQK
jgi:hypothetical protein